MSEFVETTGGPAIAYTELQATSKSVVSNYFNGPDSGLNPVNYFNMQTYPSIASQNMLGISQPTGNVDFGQKCNITIDPLGTYLCKAALAYEISEVNVLDTNIFNGHGRIRYCHNHCLSTFQDLTFAINSISTNVLNLDYLNYYRSNRLSPEERENFDHMTCNTAAHVMGSKKLKKVDAIFPAPFYFAKDYGIALQISLLKICKNEIKFNIADWTSLVVFENAETGERIVPVVGRDIDAAPRLTKLRLMGEYALIETGALAQTVKDRRLTVEHITSMNPENFNPANSGNSSYQVGFNYLQKALVGAVRNTTFNNEPANYSCGSPVPRDTYTDYLSEYGTKSPIKAMTISYGTQTKVTASRMYFNNLIPFWHSRHQPELNSHFLVQNYALDIDGLKPTGGCALSILNRVLVKVEPSQAAKTAAIGGGTLESGIKEPQKFNFVCFAISLAIMVTGPSSCVAPS